MQRRDLELSRLSLVMGVGREGDAAEGDVSEALKT